MTCNVCNQLIEPKDRAIPCDSDWYPESETWYISYNEATDEYNLIFKYDCGCASSHIRDIKFCPMCGRPLE